MPVVCRHTLVTAGLVGYLGLQNGISTASDLTNRLLTQSATRVQQNLDSFFDTARLLTEQNLAAVRLEQLDLSNLAEVQQRFLGEVHTYEIVQAVAYANAQDEFVGAFRDLLGADFAIVESTIQSNFTERAYETNDRGEHGLLLTTIPDYHPTTKTWYENAVNAGQTTWTPIYVWVNQTGIAVDAVTPVYDENDILLGVLDVSLNPSAISQFLQRLSSGQSVNAFIVDDSGLLVASSTVPTPYTRVDGTFQRFDVLDVADSIVQGASQQVIEQFGGWSDIGSSRQIEFSVDGETSLAQVYPYRGTDSRWWIVIAAQEASFMSPINEHFNRTLLLIGVSMLISIGFLTLVSHRITCPILRVSRAAKAYAAGSWSERVAVSRQDELGELAMSFNEMADQLQKSTASLQASEARLRAIFENSAEAILVVNTGGIVTFNPACQVMFGYSDSDELNNKGVLDFITPDERPRIESYIRRRLAAEVVPPMYETRGVRRDGSDFDMEVRVSTFVQNGEVYALSLLRDITERKRAEQALRESETRYRQLVENMLAALIVYDTDTNVIYANRRASTTLKLSHEQVMAHNIRRDAMTYIRRDGSPLLPNEHPVNRVLVTGESLEDFEIGVTSPGSPEQNWLLGNIYPVLNERHEVQQVVITFTDITQRKQAEFQIQEAERFARATVNALSAQIAILDEDGVILSVNDAWAQFAAQNPGRLNSAEVGSNYVHYLEGVDPDSEDSVPSEAVQVGIQAIVNNEIASFSVEYPCHSLDEKRWFTFRLTHFSGAGPTRIVVALENITEQVLSAELLTHEKYLVTERMKELNCLYSHAKLVEQPDISLKQLFQGTIDLIPPAWQYPNITCARLTVEGQRYTTLNFKESPWRQASDIIVGQHQVGTLEVFYLEEKPLEVEGPFFREERLLLDELAHRVGQKVEALQAAAALQQAHDTMEERVIQRTAQLLTEKERVEAILNSSVDGILLADNDLTVRQTNLAFDSLFGCEADGYVNKSLRDLIRAEPNDITINTILSHTASTENLYREVSAYRQDGTGFDAEISIGFIHNEGLVCVIRDITERKSAEKALRESEAKYRNLTETLRGGVAVVDVDTRFTYINDRFCELVGYTREEIIGTSADRYVDNTAIPVLESQLARRRDGEGSSYELIVRHKEGKLVSVLVSSSPMFGKHGEFTGSLAVWTDITIQKQAEAALHQALAKEKELGELKTRFVSMASHEFRTPLATILALVETLVAYRHKLEEGEIDEQFGKIKAQVGHLKDIMEDVLMLARMQARRVQFNPTMVDLDALSRSVLDEFQSRPDVKHRLTYSGIGEPYEVMLDRKLIRQMLSNLVSNAIKYSPEDKSVKVNLECTESTIHLEVRDEGIGIPEADLPYLFEPFHRAANVGTISGTGLGLVITKESVELHGGTIAVDSHVGTGTTFTIHIPIAVYRAAHDDPNPGD